MSHVTAQQPLVGQNLSTLTLSDHTQTHHTRQNSSGRGISTMQRPLPTTVNSHKRQTSMTPVRFEHDAETSTDKSQQSQETDIDDPSGIRTRNPSKLSGCRSKTQTARPLESALVLILEPNTFTKKTGIMRWVGNEAHYSFSSSFPSSFVVVVVVVAQDILRCNNDALQYRASVIFYSVNFDCLLQW